MTVKKQLVVRELMGETILVPSGETVFENNGLFMLSETAAFIWKILPKANDETEIVSRVLEEYDVTETEAKKDVADFLSKLVQYGIID